MLRHNLQRTLGKQIFFIPVSEIKGHTGKFKALPTKIYQEKAIQLSIEEVRMRVPIGPVPMQVYFIRIL